MPDAHLTAISNTSPLYYLHQIGHLEVLRELYGTIVTTPEVVAELDLGATTGLRIPDLRSLPWVAVEAVAVPRFLELITDLGRGEASVLALAIEREAALVILDDQLARRIASARDLRLTGTLGVLLRAKQLGILTAIAPALAALQAQGFYLSRQLAEYVLRLAKES